jgi:hypothetical protein
VVTVGEAITEEPVDPLNPVAGDQLKVVPADELAVNVVEFPEHSVLVFVEPGLVTVTVGVGETVTVTVAWFLQPVAVFVP